MLEASDESQMRHNMAKAKVKPAEVEVTDKGAADDLTDNSESA